MIDDFLLVNSGSTPPAPRAQSPPAPAPEESETPYQPFVLPAGGDDNDLPEGYSASDDEVCIAHLAEEPLGGLLAASGDDGLPPPDPPLVQVAGYIAQAKVKAVRAKGVLLTSAMFFAAVSLVLFAGAAGRGHMMKVAGESDAEGDVKAAGRGAEPELLLAPPSPLSYPPPPSPPTPSPPPPSPWPARVNIHWTGTYALRCG